jgi:hypothetical protein
MPIGEFVPMIVAFFFFLTSAGPLSLLVVKFLQGVGSLSKKVNGFGTCVFTNVRVNSNFTRQSICYRCRYQFALTGQAFMVPVLLLMRNFAGYLVPCISFVRGSFLTYMIPVQDAAIARTCFSPVDDIASGSGEQNAAVVEDGKSKEDKPQASVYNINGLIELYFVRPVRDGPRFLVTP